MVEILNEKSSHKNEVSFTIFYILIEALLKTNKITEKELIQILKDITENANEPLCIIQKDISKKELRQYWLYLMKHQELFCDICGNKIQSKTGKNKLTYDHIIPRSKGGKTDLENGSATHLICNNLKSDYLPEEWEKVGPAILKRFGITINHLHTIYNYWQK